MTAKRGLISLASAGLVLLWLWILNDQLPIDNRVSSCWLYDPQLRELSPSEVLSTLAWLLASLVCALRARQRPAWAWLALIFFFGALEEANYGVPYFSLLRGDWHFQGTSLHNQWEALDQRSFWFFESLAKLAVLGLLYPAMAVWAYRRSRSILVSLPYWLPALLFLLTLVRSASWHALHQSGAFIDAMVQEVSAHPCVWLEEELFELLLAGSILAWSTLGLPPRTGEHGQVGS